MSKIDYKNFYELLFLPNSQDKEEQIIKLIDTYLVQYFWDEERTWFNRLFDNGLLNIVKHCEKTIPGFSLYNHEKPPEHFNNISFLWSIESGNLELIQYFFDHPDFSFFCKHKELDRQIGSFLQYHKERRKTYEINNYKKLINMLAEKFPTAIPEIFDKASRDNKNDEITEILKDFIIKYKSELTPFLSKDKNDNLTIHCMLALDNNSYEFASFIRKQYQEYLLVKERVEILLYWGSASPSLPKLEWMISNPSFFKLEPKNFKNLSQQLFQNPLITKVKKESCEYFNYVVKCNLHTVSKDEFKLAITKNLLPVVKKNYKSFNLEEFNELSYFGNNCTRFIEKTIKEREYKKLMKELPVNGVNKKKPKI